MIYYEPIRIFEAYIYLTDKAAGFQSDKYFEKLISKTAKSQDELIQLSELIANLEKAVDSAVEPYFKSIRKYFEPITFKKDRQNITAGSIMDILIPIADDITEISAEAFFDKIKTNIEDVQTAVSFSLLSSAGEACKPEHTDVLKTFHLIKSLDMPMQDKLMLFEFLLEPMEPIERIETAMLALAARFNDERSLWQPLVEKYRQSYNCFNNDRELLKQMFGCELDFDGEYSFYPCVLGYRHYFIKGYENKVVGYLGVLFDVFRQNSDNAQNSEKKLLHTLGVLADPSRFEIFMQLVKNPSYGRELSAKLQLSAGAVSEHLSKLNGIGLITPHVQGKKVIYSVDVEQVQRLLELQHKLFLNR